MSRVTTAAAVIGAVGTIGAVAVAVVGPRETVELMETLFSDPVRELRDEPPLPSPQRPRVLLIALDGVGYESLREALESGALPRLGAALGPPRGDGVFEHAYSVPNVLSILPSTTVAAWTTAFTGVGVAEHGVSGNEQFDRTSGRFYAPAPVSVTSVADMMATFNDGLVGSMIQSPTLFEQLPGRRCHVSLGHVHRGVAVFTAPTGLAFEPIFSAFVRGALEDEPEGTQLEGAKGLDRGSVESLLEAVDEHGVPDLQVAYFPGIDLHTHVARHALESQQDYLAEVIDPVVGALIDRWREEGAWPSTWLVVTADHGHTPVLNDDRHSLGPEGADEPPAVLERLGFTMRPLQVGVADGSYSAAIAYQGAMAYVYLADRSSCDPTCDWTRPPRLEEDVLRVAEGFYRASAEGKYVPAMKGTLDLVLARASPPAGETANDFRVFDGQRLVDSDDFLQAHPRPKLLRLRERLHRLAAGPHGHLAGDVLLMARSGGDLPIEDRFYFSGPYHSWHGSPKASDSHIPVLVAHPSRSATDIRPRVIRLLGPAEGGWHSQRGLTPLVVGLMRSDHAAPDEQRRGAD
ncbi:MAG: alkaline phosphatase family protein [Myxococcota bacterium]